MARLRVREIAERKGATISGLHYETRLAMATVRRYWYGTRKGGEAGERLTEIDLDKLGAIAKALDVRIVDLINEES